MPPAAAGHAFILSAFDHDQWCPVLQCRFLIDDLEALASILGEVADGDPELRGNYILADEDEAAIAERFGARLDIDGLECSEITVFLFKPHSIDKAPYLIHTGYELPLLLEGRKKLARMSDVYPPERFPGEDRFDHWVSAGRLHKEVIDERFDKPVGAHRGVRTVYYTVPGEEWRIPAMQLVMSASGRSGDWNEYFERLEGMLFGYSDEENDWWINVGLSGGGFGGIPLCCAVDRAGLDWVEAAGFRALPPVEQSELQIESYGRWEKRDLQSLFFKDETAVAIVLFNVFGKHLMDIVDLGAGGPWCIPRERISILNRHLRGSISVIARRDAGSGGPDTQPGD